MQQPSLVYSHLQLPQVKLHWQHWMPLQVQQQLHRPSAQHAAEVLQRAASDFIVAAAVDLAAARTSFRIRRVQRGSTHQLAAAGEPAGIEPAW